MTLSVAHRQHRFVPSHLLFFSLHRSQALHTRFRKASVLESVVCEVKWSCDVLEVNADIDKLSSEQGLVLKLQCGNTRPSVAESRRDAEMNMTN